MSSKNEKRSKKKRISKVEAFSFAPPPPSGKMSRRASVKSTGRDIDSSHDSNTKSRFSTGSLLSPACSSQEDGIGAKKNHSMILISNERKIEKTRNQIKEFNLDTEKITTSQPSKKADISDSDSDISDEEKKKKVKHKKKKKKEPKPQKGKNTLTSSESKEFRNNKAEIALSPEGTINPNRKFVTVNVDVLCHMRKGHSFLKYGRRGYPHFRFVQLSKDNLEIIWFTGNKSIKDSKVKLTGVTCLKRGQTTTTFLRYATPELEPHSFSLLYKNGNKSLDLISKDANEHQIWTTGLETLISMIHEGRIVEVSKLKVLSCKVKIRNKGKIFPSIVDFETGQKASTMLGMTEQKNVEDDSQMNTNSAKKLVKHVKLFDKQVQSTAEKLRNEKFQMDKHYETMNTMLKRIEKCVEAAYNLCNDGNYDTIDDDIWKAGVELEALIAMMKSVK